MHQGGAEEAAVAPSAGAVTVAANAVAAAAAGLTAAGPAAQLPVSVSSFGTSPTAKPSDTKPPYSRI